MALKDKKLHPDGIQGIRGFTMAYKGLATFAWAYKKLAQIIPCDALQMKPCMHLHHQ
jgi:hypothetical protein